MTKQTVSKFLKDMSIHDFEYETTDSVISLMKALSIEAHSKWEDVSKVYFSVDYDDILNVYAERLETDDEYQDRINIEKNIEDRKRKAKDKEEKAERALFLRLKKKYDK